MTEELLKECEEIAALDRGRTPGRWIMECDCIQTDQSEYVTGESVVNVTADYDLEFIEAAPRMAELIAKLVDKVRELEGRGDKFTDALNPRVWTCEQNEAWHKNIPDIQKAFDALRKVLFES